MDFNNFWIGHKFLIIFLVIIWYLIVVSFVIWAYEKKGLLGFLLVAFLSVLGVLIVILLPADKKFRCGSCYRRRKNELLGGTVFRKEEVQVCQPCLERIENQGK